MNFTTDHQQQYLIQPMTGFVLTRTHQSVTTENPEVINLQTVYDAFNFKD